EKKVRGQNGGSQEKTIKVALRDPAGPGDETNGAALHSLPALQRAASVPPGVRGVRGLQRSPARLTEGRGDALKKVRIAVDAMGADAAPRVEVEGVLAAASETDVEIVLVGDEPRLRALWEALHPSGLLRDRVHILHAPEVIGMDEAPS